MNVITPASLVFRRSLFTSAVLVFLLITTQLAAGSDFQQLFKERFNVSGDVKDSLVLENGQIIIGGNFETVNSVRQPRIARLNTDGTLDSSWQPDVPFVVERVAADSTYIYFAGRQGVTPFGDGKVELGRVPIVGDGTVDGDWAPVLPTERRTFEDGEDLAVAGGYVYYLSTALRFSRSFKKSRSRLLLRRFLVANAQFDTQWGAKVVQSFDQFVSTAVLQVDANHAYVAHADFRLKRNAPALLTRFSVQGSGAIDRSWKYVIRPTFFGRVNEIAQDADFLYIGGSGLRVPGAHPKDGGGLARISKKRPVIDRSWPPAGDRAAITFCSDVTVRDGFTYALDSSLLAKISTTDLSGEETTTVSNPNNAYDRVAAGTQSIFLTVSDNAYVAEIEVVRSHDRQSLISRDSFRTRIFNEGVVKKVQRLPNGVTIVSGQFSAVGDIPARNLVRFLPNGTLDREWLPQPFIASSPVNDFQVAGDSIYVFAGFDLEKISLASPGQTDEEWNPEEDLGLGFVDAAVFTGEDLYFVYIKTNGSGFPSVVARVPLVGDDTPKLLDVRGELGGELFLTDMHLYVRMNDSARVPRFRLDTENTKDTSWNLEFASEFGVHSLASADGFLYFTEDSTVRRYLESGTGLPDPAWNPTFDPRADEEFLNLTNIVLAGNHLYVSAEDSPFAYIRRVSLAGEVDPSFKPQIPFITRFDSAGFPDLDLSGPRWIGAMGESPVLGGALVRIDGVPSFPPVILSALPAPILTRSGLNIFPSLPAESANLVELYRITRVEGGTLSLAGAGLQEGDFVPVGNASVGFVFSPTVANGPQSVTIASAFQGADGLVLSPDTVIDMTEPAPVRNRYVMTAGAVTVREGTGSAVITVQKVGTDAGQVTVKIENGLARAGEHFDVPESLTISFPPGDGIGSVLVPLRDDLVYTGNKDFRVVLVSAPGDGIIADPTATIVTIQDDDPLGITASVTTRPPLPANPAGNATLRVQLNAALGAWRLLGEVGWHAGGETLPGLTRGNYFLEFRPVNGFITPLARTVPVDFGESALVVGDYVPLVTAGTGGFVVNIQPDTVANGIDAARGQWRLVGETQWRDSGSMADDLPIGSYQVEFKTVPGRITPPELSVNVAASIIYSVTGTYLIESLTTGTAPSALSFASVQSDPYQYVGQIHTPLGHATGTAVRSRVVLTVAHALFDDVTLSPVTDARWYHQKARRDYEPPPQVARGWYIFEGYSAQRTADLSTGNGSIGVSTAESQKLDIAAMWFLSPVARGSFAGYLRTDDSNDWLLAARRRILAGYPVDGVTENDRGVMHATGPDVPSTFTAPNASVRATDSLRGYPGMSGGPLFVEHEGKFYPAGVFLGGTAQTLVRVIDSAAVDLINRAEISGNGGDNNVGGGITLVAPGITASPFTPTLIGCEIAPAGAVAQGAVWRLAGEKNFHAAGSRLPRIEGTYRVEFKPVPGFATPPSQAVTLVQGQVATVKGNYLPSAHVGINVTPANSGTAPAGDYALNREATLVAKPAPGFIFASWKDENDQVIGNSATLKLTINGPRSLTASFAPGSFLTYGGTYAGFREGSGGSDGGVLIEVTKDGVFTGQVVYEGKVFRVKGKFDPDGFFTGSLGKAHFTLKLDRSSPVGVITGTIFDNDPPSIISATQSPFSRDNPTSLAGIYTLVLPAADITDVTVPAGTGGASLTLLTTGAARFKGSLADGTPISGGTYLVDGNVLPFFADVKSGERIAGNLGFTTTTPPHKANGTVSWTKDPSGTDKLYPAGFTTEIAARLSAFNPGSVIANVQTLLGSGGGLAEGFERTLTFNSKGIGTASGDSSVKLKLDAETGRFSGAINLSGMKLTLGGIIDQETGKGLGFFLGDGPLTGSLELIPPAQ
jgi:hypothetical protein